MNNIINAQSTSKKLEIYSLSEMREEGFAFKSTVRNVGKGNFCFMKAPDGRELILPVSKKMNVGEQITHVTLCSTDNGLLAVGCRAEMEDYL